MREKPILFSTPMVQAIQDLRKNMTRRLNNLEEINQEPDKWSFKGFSADRKGNLTAEFYDGHGRSRQVKCPWQPGDLLWVRETWCNAWAGYQLRCKDKETSSFPKYIYKTEMYKENRAGIDWMSIKWKPSIHMPKVAARIWLEVTDVRVERLQELTEEDAIKEGVLSLGDPSAESNWGIGFAKACFRKLWDSLNAKRGYGWDPNPWVWVISFKKVTPCD